MSVLSYASVMRSRALFSIIGLICICDKALATSCQVYPSEYAYEDDSVTRTESASANCRNYPAGQIPGGVHPEHYIHCDGTQLKLTDSNFGQEQYQPTDYHVWSSRSGEQLMFIFPTRVSLTTITLHYYSDSVRGLPRLIFYGVPDDFDVWDAPKTSYPRVDVASDPPDGEPASRRSVSINIHFNTKRVLMFKSSHNIPFAARVSEVEFFTSNHGRYLTSSVTTHLTTPTKDSLTTKTEDGSYRTQPSSSYQTTSNSRTREITAWVLVVLLAVLLIVSLAVHVIQAIWTYGIYTRNKNADMCVSPDCVLAMDSNPCYEASNVKQTEAQEAGHVYDTVKQHS